MRRGSASPMFVRFTAIIFVISVLATVVVLSQGDGEKTWDDAMQLYEQGVAAYGQERFLDAIELYEEALVIVRQLGQRPAEGTILNNLGICYVFLSDYQRAIDYLEQALAICRDIGDRANEMSSLNGLGVCYISLSGYQQAIDYFEQALVIQREIGDRAGEADTLLKLGDCYKSLFDYQGAIGYFKKLLVIKREIGDRAGEARSLNSLGICYYSLSDYHRAIGHYEQALTISREIGNHGGEAEILNNLGICYQSLSGYERAIGYCGQALAIFREIGARTGEAICLSNLGLSFFYLSDYGQAIHYQEQSLEICREIGDRAGEAKSLGHLGNCYDSLSAYQRAIDYQEQSLSLFREIEDRAGEADTLSDLGVCYFHLSDYQRAIDYYEQSLVIKRKIGDREGEAVSVGNLGSCNLRLSNYQQAIDQFEQALAIQREIGDRAGEARSLGQLGNCYESLSDYQRAISYYGQSLVLSIDLGTLAMEWLTQWGLGRTSIKLGDLSRAVPHYEAAIEIVEAIRGTVSEEELRQSYFGSVRTLYEEYLELLLATGRIEETVFVAERLRARTFLDLVAEGPIGPLEKIGEEGIRSGVVEASVIEADLAEVVASLPKSTAAIEYFVTEDATYLWLITGGVTGEPIRIDILRSELRDLIVAFRIAIETSSTGLMNPPDEATFTMSRDLYKLLIAPVEDLLGGIDHLIIIPSGPLYYLPFCALLNCEDCKGPAFFGGEYLVERYAISYTPSLTVLKYVRALAGNVLPDSVFLALADPKSGHPTLQRLPEAQDEAQAAAGLFDASEVYVDTAATEDVVLARASSASQLLLSTHGLFNPHNPMFSYLLLSPTEDNDGRLYAYEVFGLDLHTDLVTLSACETLLPALEDITAQVQATVRGGKEDEEVELDERLLATLTAGDEIVGLTRAFICAGTPSVLSTLWKVVSETTKPLIMEFYEYLEEGMAKVRALQRAQLDLMASYPHPRYWAAFSLFGDWGEESDSANAWLSKLSPELVEAWAAWQSQDQGPNDEPPLVAVVMTITESVTEELLGVISELSEKIAVKGSFGHFVEADVPVNLLPALCGLQEIESVTPPWMTTNSP